jgi:fibronectin-binding autotransporter adhesin
MYRSRWSRIGIKAVAAASAAASLLAGRAVAQVSGSWVVDADGSWSAGSNWSSNPSFPDVGGLATFALFPSYSQTRQITQDLSNVTLNGLTFDSPIRFILATPAGFPGNTITLAGAAPTINVPRSNAGSPSLVPAGHFVGVHLSGAGGLIKNGAGVVTFADENDYTGGTVINAGVLAIAAGDASLGDAAGTVTLNNGATLRVTNLGMNGTRAFVLGAGAATIETAGGGATVGGVISGTGALNKSGTADFLALTSANSYSGATNVRAGTLILAGNGSALSTSAILAGGTVVLDNSGSVNSANRLDDTTPVQLLGSGLTVVGNAASATSEAVGTTTFNGGVTFYSVQSNAASASTTLISAAAVRADHGTVFFRGAGLGNVPGGSASNIYFAAPPQMIGGGGAAGQTNISIIPWAWGGAGNTIASNNAADSLVTYDANGVRPLNSNEYATALPAGVSTNNVRIGASTTLNNASTINSLLMVNSNAAPITISGTGTLTPTSGVIFNLATAGTISTAVDFASAEGIVHATSIFTMSGQVSGSGGLTKSGFGSLRLRSSASDYTGPTTILGGDVTFTGDVVAGAAGPLGSDSSAIVMAPGSSIGGTGGVPFARLWTGGAGTTTVSRDLIVRGNPIAVCGLGTNGSFADQVLVMNGNISLQSHLELQGDPVTPMIINGTISGPGLLSDGFAAAQTINGNNTYSGGTEIHDGQWFIGSDTALGSGTVWFSTAGGRLAATGGARTISNPVVFLAPTTINGTVPLTLAGPIDLGGMNLTHTINNTATTIYSGSISGGGLTKAGNGVLVLEGNNTYTGGTSVNAGTTVAATSSALGSGRLNISSTGNAKLNQNLAGGVKLSGLTIVSGGKLDLTNNSFILDYTGPAGTIATDTRAMVEDGRIFSSAADASHRLAFADNVVLNRSTFAGQSVDASSLFIKFTFAGDSNLDGQVDVTDLGNLATHWQTSSDWTGGDFNYDHSVDVSDLGMLATNWQQGVGSPLAPSRLEEALAAVGLSNVAVPEPAALTISMAIFFTWRRRSRRPRC